MIILHHSEHSQHSHSNSWHTIDEEDTYKLKHIIINLILLL